jgi:hypothetical protein
MLRAALALILLTCLVFQADAESTAAAQRWIVVTSTVPVRPMTRPPEAIRVQEPYCEFGVGPCGGTCIEESGKRWYCGSNAIPCYQRGQHCTCEVASMCLPEKKQ